MASNSLDSGTNDYFGLPEELTPERYVEIANEVLEITSLLFAPFGAARAYDKINYKQNMSLGDAGNLKDEFQDIFQRTMDSVAESVYRSHGLSEGTVALSCHTLLEGISRNQSCLNIVQKTQQALLHILKPPKILELSNTITLNDGDPNIKELNVLASKISEASSILSGGLPSTSNKQPEKNINSAGWSGSYIGTIFALGFKMNTTTSPNKNIVIDNNEQEQDNEINKTIPIDTLLGQKLKMRSTCKALNKIRIEDMVNRQGGSLNYESLQAYSETLWDDVRNRRRSHQCNDENNDENNKEDDDDGKSEENQEKCGLDSRNNDVTDKNKNFKITEEKQLEEDKFLNSLSEASQLSIAWKTQAFINHPDIEENNESGNGNSSSGYNEEKNLKENALRVQVLSHSRSASEKLSLIMKGGGVGSKTCDDALRDVNKAINLAWGSTMTLERIASLLCLRAQLNILYADMEMQQAMTKRESSMNSWYGGQEAMKAVATHELQANRYENEAHRDIEWAKQLCPSANGVRRWNAELELRKSIEALEEMENTTSSSEEFVIDGMSYAINTFDAEEQERNCLKAKNAITDLCRAFVNDGSRDASLAQALEDGSRSSTKSQARKAFREQMYSIKTTTTTSKDKKEEENGKEETCSNNNNKEKLLPASWLIESFTSGFFIPSKLFISELPYPPSFHINKIKNINDIDDDDDDIDENQFDRSKDFMMDENGIEWNIVKKNENNNNNDDEEEDGEISFQMKTQILMNSVSSNNHQDNKKLTWNEHVISYLKQWRPTILGDELKKEEKTNLLNKPSSSLASSFPFPFISYPSKKISKLIHFLLDHEKCVKQRNYNQAYKISLTALEYVETIILIEYNLQFHQNNNIQKNDHQNNMNNADMNQSGQSGQRDGCVNRNEQVFGDMLDLEKEAACCLSAYLYEIVGTYYHLTCSFIHSENAFLKCIQLLKYTNNVMNQDREQSQKEQEEQEEQVNEEYCKDVIVWTKQCMFILSQWKQSSLMRSYAKLALALTDGTEVNQKKTIEAFQSSLDVLSEFDMLSDGELFNEDLFNDFVSECCFSTKSPNYQYFNKSININNDDYDDDEIIKVKKNRIELLNQEKEKCLIYIVKQNTLVLLSNAIGVYLQRGQIRLINNELDIAQEDLDKAKALVDSFTRSSFYKEIVSTIEKAKSPSSSSSSSFSSNHQDQDFVCYEKAFGILQRLDAAVLGSLAVCFFKTDLIRNGGAGVMGGMAYGMQRILRNAEQKHPEQGELLLLHGDILSQLGDFGGALKKFKAAAEASAIEIINTMNDQDDVTKTDILPSPPSPSPSSSAASSSSSSSRLQSDQQSDNEIPPSGSETNTPIPISPTALPRGCPLPYVNAGRAYLAMNEHVLAEKHLLKAMEIDPTCASCHLDLGQLRLQGGDVKAALGHFKEALLRSRSFPEFHDAMACEFVAMAHQKAVDELLL